MRDDKMKSLGIKDHYLKTPIVETANTITSSSAGSAVTRVVQLIGSEFLKSTLRLAVLKAPNRVLTVRVYSTKRYAYSTKRYAVLSSCPLCCGRGVSARYHT